MPKLCVFKVDRGYGDSTSTLVSSTTVGIQSMRAYWQQLRRYDIIVFRRLALVVVVVMTRLDTGKQP
jgi:hypothetical protein